MTTAGIRKIRNMVDKVGEGDLAGAQDAFDTAVMARREAQIKDYKTVLAQNSFQPPEPHPGQDTGITGAPDEIGEGLGDIEFNRLKGQQARRQKEAARKAEREAKRAKK